MLSTPQCSLLSLLAIFLAGSLLFSCQPPTAMEEGYYAEPHRPQFHFSPQEKWMNDPNGMVYYEGEYHLFYQYYPDSTVWGPMHWGHAVSKDMVHWEHLPIALYPDSLGWIFSGSAVVDWKNTSGLGQDGQPPLIAIFTHHNAPLERDGRQDFQYQSIAYSNDRGRTWAMYAGNPVVPNPGIRDFRDPKVIWHEGTQQWIMVFAAMNQVKLYGSPDLINWAHLSDFGREYGSHGGVWECPDLFPLDADDGTQKWALLLSINPGGPNGGSATQYFVGDFDGKTFTLDPTFAEDVQEEKAVWLDWGRDNYAGVTWSDVPAEDGRRLFIGWMSNWDYGQAVPTHPWRSAMTLPRTLVLKKTAAGYRLFSQPVNELEELRSKKSTLAENTYAGTLDLTEKIGFSPRLAEMMLEFELLAGAPAAFGIELSNSLGERYRVGYDAVENRFFSDRTQAGDSAFSEKFAPGVHYASRLLTGDTVRLHLFFDSSSAELFADGGSVALTDVFFPSEDFSVVKLFAEGGRAKLIGGEAYRLKGIWR